MVQGLAFLSKKSWHTKNISNQEKVWIAEEREKDEKAKTAELAKQIQQEREDEELNQIAGKKKLDRGIDWMYTSYHKDSETAKEDAAKEAEEYLLGKEFAPAAKLVGDLDTAAADSHAGVNAVVASAAAAAAIDDDRKRPAYYQEEDSVAQRNEAFRLRHEDPMFAVSLQAVRKEKSMEQRKDLYEKAGISLRTVPTSSTGDIENGSQKGKKEPKKKKKSKKRYRMGSSDPRDNDDIHGREERGKRHRRSAFRERSRYDDDEDSYHRRSNSHHRRSNRDQEDRFGKNSSRRSRRSPSTGTHEDDSLDYMSDDVHNDRTSHDRERSSAQRRRKSFEQKDEDYRRLDSYAAQHGHQSRKGIRKPPPPAATAGQYERPRGSNETNTGSAISGDSNAMYGLQREKSNTQIGGSNDLGPNRELLQRKRKEREAERFRIKESSRRRHDQTRAEREAALSAMKRDAAVHAATRDRHQQPHHHDDKDEVGLHGSGQAGTSFLRAVTQRAHGINSDMHVSMSSRLQQNQNTNQRANDESFL